MTMIELLKTCQNKYNFVSFIGIIIDKKDLPIQQI